ncbi:MAG: stage III sporulation protein AB [Clostridia bacterium]|nr:stage III sporulation protein AB [Clostridia bacterium]
MVLTGAVLTGMMISSRLKKRVEILEAVEIFISSVSLEIEFVSLPVYEILRKTACFEGCKELDFIGHCLSKMEGGEDFKSSWAAGVELSALPFKREEKEKLKSLGALIGTSDAEGQRAMLSLYGSYFSFFSDNARKECEKYGRTGISLSVLLGLGILILLM